jgi:hypothetical protein
LKNKGKNKGRGIFFERGWKEKVYYFEIYFFITFLTGKFLYIYAEYITHFPHCPFNFIISSAIVFSENGFAYSNICFWNILHFSIVCLHWKLLTSISESFSWDDNCKLVSKYPKTIARIILFSWGHLRKVGILSLTR